MAALTGRRRPLPWIVLLATLLVTIVLVARYVVAYPVVAVQSGPRRLLIPAKGAGELTAREQAEITSKSSLKVKAVLVEAGHPVKREQALVLLDSEELAAQVRVAEAAAQAARLAVDAARLAHQRAEVLRQRSAADTHRATTLAAQDPDAISTSEVEAHAAAARSSQLDVDTGTVQITMAQQAHVQALASLDVARERLHDATLRAPFDGLVTSRHCGAGDIASPSTACLTLVDPASLRVRARFDESALATVRVGDTASLVLKSQPHRPIKARVERANRSVDTDTREFTVDVQLAEIPAGWALGERATVEVEVRERTVPLAIPLSYVVASAARRGVWVAHDGRARWTALRLGANDGHQVEVLDGLLPGELVLQPRGLRPAMRVQAEVRRWGG